MIRMRTWLFVTLSIFLSTFSITMAGMWALTVWLPGLAKSNPFEATAVIMLFAALITTINLKWFFVTAKHGFADASWEQCTKSTFEPCDCGCGRSCCSNCGVDVGFVREIDDPRKTAQCSEFDRIEFAMRDAGFDYDTAFRIAHMCTLPEIQKAYDAQFNRN